MRHLAHLVRRFFGSWGVQRPDPSDQALVAGLLSPTEAETFWSQPGPDLAHAIRSAHGVLDTRPGRRELARAALLHDIGKRHSDLGTVRRSIATGLALLRFPLRGQMARYLDHGAIGAEELSMLGCEDIVVQFARHHHGPRPAHLSPEDWNTLVSADDE